MSETAHYPLTYTARFNWTYVAGDHNLYRRMLTN